MDRKPIGIALEGTRVAEIQTAIERAEQLGIKAAWMPTGGAQLDNITTLATAAARTRSIMLGTSIVPIYPRHPLVMAQQVQVVAQLAPGRSMAGDRPQPSTRNATHGYKYPAPAGPYARVLEDTEGAATRR